VPVIDVIGAGDAFTAGYLSGRIEGLDPRDRLERANALGASAVACDGDWEGLPTRAELAHLTLPSGEALR
jgi:2-dehydro-3-deoxygluconokinase